MDEDDPEKRIAELERQAASMATEPIECEWCKKQNEPGSTNCSICGARLVVKDRVSDPVSSAASMPPPPAWGPAPAPSYPRPSSRSPTGRLFFGIAVVLVVMTAFLLLSRSTGSHGGGTTSVGTTVLRGGNETFTGSNETDVVTCNGGDVSVTGGSSNVIVTGHCATVSVAGHNNQVRIDTTDTVHVDGTSNNVRIDSAGTINTSGSNNTVAYDSGAPHITDTGSSNDIHRGFGG